MYKAWIMMILYQIKQEGNLPRSCVVDARRILLFMVEQGCLLMGEDWSMYITDTQCAVQGREEAIGQRKIVMLKLFSTCLRIGIFISSI